MSDVERQLLRVLAENKMLRQGQQNRPALPTGGGPHDPGIEARLVAVEVRMTGIEDRMDGLVVRMDRLESRMDGIDTRLRAVEQGIATLNGKMDVLVSQVVSKLPSWWQMPAVIGSTIAVLAAAYAAAQYLRAHGLL
jgi:hypothetical protein